MKAKTKPAAFAPDFDTMRDIIGNYIQTEESIVNQLYFTTKHGPTIGGFREEIWKQLFEQIVPKKFVIEQSVFIIDSKGQVSNEVDLAIFDEIYTPYIFRNGRLKFIPIEAVAAVVECKSTSLPSERLKKWSNSITNLQTSRNAVARMHAYIATENFRKLSDRPPETSTQTGTRPLQILCHTGRTCKEPAKLFDFVLYATKVSKKIAIKINCENTTLKDWFNDLNHNDQDVEEDHINSGIGFQDEGRERNNYFLDDYRVLGEEQREVSLLSFNLQFNQLLMLINNPMLFPHKAYADMFNEAYSTKPSQASGGDDQ